MADNKFGSFMLFALGAAIGSASAWQLAKRKYAQIAQEEIDSVKERYAKDISFYISSSLFF
jgi:hypothetical protein